MIALRLLLIIVVMTLLALLAAGAYVYNNLPQLLSQHSAQLLAAYGVTAVRLDSFDVNHRQATVGVLELGGEQDGRQFEAQLRALTLRYALGDLLRGRVHGLEIDSAAVTIVAPAESAAVASPSSPQPLSELLPYRLASSLPLDALAVSRLSLKYVAGPDDALEVAGNLSIAEEAVDSHLQAAYSGVTAELEISSDADGPLRVMVDAAINGADTATLQLALQEQPGKEQPGKEQPGKEQPGKEQPGKEQPGMHWQWQLAAETIFEPLLEWVRTGPIAHQLTSFSEPLAAMNARGSTRIEATLIHKDDVLTVLSEGVPVLQAVTVQGTGSHKLDALAYGEILHSAVGSFTSAFTVQRGSLAVQLSELALVGSAPATQLGVDKELSNWLGLSAQLPFELFATSVAVNAHQDATRSVALGGVSVVVGDTQSRVQALVPTLTIDSLPAVAADAGQFFVTALNATMNARLRGQQLPTLAASLEQEGALASSDVQVALQDTAGSVHAHLSSSGDLLSGQSSLKVQLSSANLANTSAIWLPSLQALGLLEENIAVSEGSVELRSQLRTAEFALDDASVKSTLSIGDVSGDYGDYRFDAFDLDARWRGIEQLQTLAPVQFTLDRLDIGIPVSDVSVQLELPQRAPPHSAELVINTATANLLGGRAYVPPGATWTFGGASNQLLLKVENWQIAQLIALQGSEDIQADGQLSGDLPITVNSGRVIIKDGFIEALSPGGSIRYSPTGSAGDMVAGNKELALAVELLQNFSYESLRSDVALDQSGNLALGLSIAGRNPDYSSGRAVNFNINLEQNIDPLLQSLQLSDKLIEELERKRK